MKQTFLVIALKQSESDSV